MTTPHGLGRIPSPFDHRDYLLADYLLRKVEAVPTHKLWHYPYKPLDQGQTPHCVGFGIAAFGNSLPVTDNYHNTDGDAFYYDCKEVDREPKAEDGSTVRSAAKVMQAKGLISKYAFAHTMTEVRYWLLTQGPMLAGTVWTNDMFMPDAQGFVTPTGGVAGGHCWLLEGVKDDYYYGRCSWGEWGLKNGGMFLIKEKDLARLFRHGGEILAAVELPHDKPVEA